MLLTTSPTLRAALLVTLLSFVSTAADAQAPLGDYGDAPDVTVTPLSPPTGIYAGYAAPFDLVEGTFPTTFATTNSRYGLPGAHTLSTTDCWLGETVTVELGALDELDGDGQPNLDDDDAFDDGLVGGFCTVPATDPSAPVTLTFDVTVAPGAPASDRYLNVLIDTNRDGKWDGEWYVADLVVVVAPGTTTEVTTPPFVLPVGLEEAWMRVTITTTPAGALFVDDGSGWDGSGAFAAGEIEDIHLFGETTARESAIMADIWADVAIDYESEISISFASVSARLAALEAAAVSVTASAAAASVAAATGSASAVTFLSAEAESIATAAAEACAEASVIAGEIVSASAMCPCAAVSVEVGAVISANAEACATIEATMTAAVSAMVSAVATAEALVIAATSAEAEVSVQVTAIATALAAADAAALAIADASALAIGYSSAAALAAADAKAAACGGNADAAAAALAIVMTNADAIALANTDVLTAVEVFAALELELLLAVDVATAATAEAATYSSAAGYAESQAMFTIDMTSATLATAVAQTDTMASTFASTTAACFACPAGGMPSLSNGDVNGDHAIDISDVINTLQYLFEGGPAPVQIHCQQQPPQNP